VGYKSKVQALIYGMLPIIMCFITELGYFYNVNPVISSDHFSCFVSSPDPDNILVGSKSRIMYLQAKCHFSLQVGIPIVNHGYEQQLSLSNRRPLDSLIYFQLIYSTWASFVKEVVSRRKSPNNFSESPLRRHV
jgi:hypothetical protein